MQWPKPTWRACTSTTTTVVGPLQQVSHVNDFKTCSTTQTSVVHLTLIFFIFFIFFFRKLLSEDKKVFIKAAADSFPPDTMSPGSTQSASLLIHRLMTEDCFHNRLINILWLQNLNCEGFICWDGRRHLLRHVLIFYTIIWLTEEIISRFMIVISLSCSPECHTSVGSGVFADTHTHTLLSVVGRTIYSGGNHFWAPYCDTDVAPHSVTQLDFSTIFPLHSVHLYSPQWSDSWRDRNPSLSHLSCNE